MIVPYWQNIQIADSQTHIKTKPTSQERKAFSINENFLAIIKIEIANKKDHNPQIAPLIGSDGNTSPNF